MWFALHPHKTLLDSLELCYMCFPICPAVTFSVTTPFTDVPTTASTALNRLSPLEHHGNIRTKSNSNLTLTEYLKLFRWLGLCLNDSLQLSFALEGSIRWKGRAVTQKGPLSRERTSIIPAGRAYTLALLRCTFWPLLFCLFWWQSCHPDFQNGSACSYPLASSFLSPEHYFFVTPALSSLLPLPVHPGCTGVSTNPS